MDDQNLTEAERADKKQAELDFLLAQTRRFMIQSDKMRAEEPLTVKKVRWYEVVIVGGIGLSAGISIAKMFMQ